MQLLSDIQAIRQHPARTPEDDRIQPNMPRKLKTQFDTLSGTHSVREGLKANRRVFYGIYASRPPPGEIASAARERGVPVHRKTAAELAALAGTDQHQQIAAKTSPFPQAELPHMLRENASANSPGADCPSLYLVIDGVEDPRNLGALIRSAVCAGVCGIIVPKNRSAPLTPTVSRTSAGAMEHCAICRAGNLVSAIKELKKNGVWVTGLDRKGTLSIFDTDMTGPHAIVVGGEHTGIRRLVAETCDNLCHIPQFGPVNSLNASVSGAIAVYEALRQRRHGGRKKP